MASLLYEYVLNAVMSPPKPKPKSRNEKIEIVPMYSGEKKRIGKPNERPKCPVMMRKNKIQINKPVKLYLQ